MKMRFLRILFVSTFMAASLMAPSAANAQEPPPSSSERSTSPTPTEMNYIPGADDPVHGELDHVISPKVGGYKTISFAGMDFLPRKTQITTSYISTTGCITAGTENPNYLVDVHLPRGSRIIGLTYQYRNYDANSSYLFFTGYKGDGTVDDIFWVLSSSGTGYQESYGQPTNPYTVDNEITSLNLVWVPQNSGDWLCGGTLHYIEPTTSFNDNYWFASAYAFMPADSSTTKDNDGGYGCVFRPTGSHALVMDLDLPNGTVIHGFRLYYYSNAQTERIWSYLYRFDMTGGGISLGDFQSTKNSGFSAEYFALASPEVVNTNSAYILGIHPGSTTSLSVCGIRVFLSYPAGVTATAAVQSGLKDVALDSTRPLGLEGNYQADEFRGEATEEQSDHSVMATTQTRSIAGAAFHPIDGSTTMSYQGYGCVSLGTTGTKYLVKSVVLPQYAKVLSVRLYFYEVIAGDSVLVLTQSGRGGILNRQIVDSTGNAGYGTSLSTQAAFEHLPGSNSLSLLWDSLDSSTGQQLCGVKITYEIGYKSFMGLILK